jgi:hypothetical protein
MSLCCKRFVTFCTQQEIDLTSTGARVSELRRFIRVSNDHKSAKKRLPARGALPASLIFFAD